MNQPLWTLLILPSQLLAFEFFQTADGSVLRWNLASQPEARIHWRLGVEAPPQVRQALLMATSAWSQASGGVIQFAEGEGGIVVNWSSSISVSDPAHPAYTVLRSENNWIVGATIKINAANFNWARESQPVSTIEAGFRTLDLDAVIVHEIGHALGLNHSDDLSLGERPSMNHLVTAAAKTLAPDDILGLRTLYGISEMLTVAPKPARGRAPLKVVFSQVGGGSETRWDFGDGTATTTAGSRPFHRYKTPGLYTVIAESNGAVTSVQIEVEKRRKSR